MTSGVGVVSDVQELYQDMHAYLAGSGLSEGLGLASLVSICVLVHMQCNAILSWMLRAKGF